MMKYFFIYTVLLFSLNILYVVHSDFCVRLKDLNDVQHLPFNCTTSLPVQNLKMS
jgi:hypothetical protein